MDCSMKNLDIFDRIRGGLIVSCQALENEPLHSSFIMSRMAVAAEISGAAGIRANTVADITEIRSCYEEALHAVEIGFDCVGTTMAGYTPYTQGVSLPDLAFLQKISQAVDVPVIAEGGIHYPQQLRQALDAGAFCAVVGGAITRPQEITKRFVEVL